MSDSSDISNQSISSRPEQRQERTVTFSSHLIKLIVLLIVLCGLSFYLGVAYEKGHVKTTAPSTTARYSGQGGFAGGQGFGERHSGGFGAVTAISSTSLTLQNSRTGTSTTYAVTSSTKITDNGQAVSSSSITVGETVVVTTSGSGSTTATAILVNPSFGGGGNASGSSTSSGSATSSSD